jgi:hypothetical protein
MAAQGNTTELTAWERFKAYSHHEKEIAVKEGRRLIAATDKKIADLKAAAKSAGKEAKAGYDADVKALESKKKEAQAHLDKMSNATAAGWDATKEGFAAAYRDLHHAYNKAAAAAKK